MTKPQKWMIVTDFALIILCAYVWLAMVPEAKQKPVQNDIPSSVTQMGTGAKKTPSSKPPVKPVDKPRTADPYTTKHTVPETLQKPSRTVRTDIPEQSFPTRRTYSPSAAPTTSSPEVVTSEPVVPSAPAPEEEPAPLDTPVIEEGSVAPSAQ